jgi:Holliday junction resolvasome RuvABC endonuclease subunit
MNILAIDPGSRQLGWVHMLQEDKRIVIVDTLELPDRKEDKYPILYYFIRMQLEGIIVGGYKKITPDIVVLESFFTQSFKGTTIIPEVRGIIQLAVFQQKGPALIEVAPGTVKKVVAGKGNATKDEVRRAVTNIYNDAPILSGLSNDAIDAIAIGLTGIRKMELGLEKGIEFDDT